MTENSIVLRITVLHPENGEGPHEIAEDVTLLTVKDGQITERHVMRFYDVEDNKIKHRRVYFEMPVLLQQLGVPMGPS